MDNPQFKVWYHNQWKQLASTYTLKSTTPKRQQYKAWMAGQAALLPALQTIKEPTEDILQEIARLEEYVNREE